MKCKECGAHLPYGAYGHIRCEFCNTPNYVPVPGEKSEAAGKIEAKREQAKRKTETVSEEKDSSKGALKKVIFVGLIFMAVLVVLGVIGLLLEDVPVTPDPTYTPKPTYYTPTTTRPLKMTAPPTTTKAPITPIPPTKTSAPLTIKPATNFLMYDNPTYGIKIKYPMDWKKQEQVRGAIVLFLSQEGYSLNIVTEDISHIPMTLTEYADISINQLSIALPDFNLISSKRIVLANNPAHQIVYTYQQEQMQTEFKNMQIFTIKNDIAYVITYTGMSARYSGYLNTVEEMLDSFELASQATPTTTAPPTTAPPTTTQAPTMPSVSIAWESNPYSYTSSEVTYEILIEVHNDGKADTKDLEIWAYLATAEPDKVWDQYSTSIPDISKGGYRTKTVYLTAPLDKATRIEISATGSNFETVESKSAWFDT